MRIFGAPGRYIQGPGAIGELGDAAAALSRSACVVVDAGVRTPAAVPVKRSLLAAGGGPGLGRSRGEVTYAAIDRLAEEARETARSPGSRWPLRTSRTCRSRSRPGM